MRWLVPHCLILALASNIALAGQTFYSWGLLGQFTFYALAGFGWWRTRKGVAPSISRLPLFFVSMNLGLLLGFWRYVAGQTSGVWARSAR